MKKHLPHGLSRPAAKKRTYLPGKRSGLFFYLLLLFSAFTGSRLYGQASVSNLSFTQFDRYDQTGKLLFQNSSLGQVRFSVSPDAGKTYYVNIYAKTLTDKTAWIVQNLPVEVTTEPIATTCAVTSIDLKLLEVTPGTKVDQISYSVTVTPALAKVAVVVESTSLKERIRASQVTNQLSTTPTPVYTTVPVYKSALVSEASSWYNESSDLALFTMATPVATTNKDKDIPPVEEDPNGCLPGSFARSIAWLLNNNNMNPGKRSAQDIYDSLQKRFQGCGLSDTCRINRKRDYLKEISGNKGSTTFIYPITSSTDTIKKYNDKCDIELRMEAPTGPNGIGHVITIVGITCGTDGCCTIKYRDDESQGKPGGDSCIKTTTICGDSITYGGKKRKVSYLVIECMASSNKSLPVTDAHPERNAELLQNVPNPFGNTTTISIRVKNESLLHNAVLIISNGNGNELKRQPLVLHDGMNQLKYTPPRDVKGMLYYSLEIDGKLIGSRKMFVSAN